MRCAALFTCMLLLAALARGEEAGQTHAPAIAIHGGAGTMKPASLTPDVRTEIEATLRRALDAGYGVLEDGGSSLDAVVAAILVLEDSPFFNAGRGAVFTHDGRNELDASIMEGQGLGAGAVGGVEGVKNPILLARRVMEASPHVLLTGTGAAEFAREEGLEFRPATYFHTERRWRQLEKARERTTSRVEPAGYFGTVGAVALDRRGHLAAGTSTGGMTNKRWGRLGDSPIIGAGTYASDAAGCAVSATGHGEYFIRAAVAHDICARAAYGGVTVGDAAETVVLERLEAMGGDGGVITLDGEGRIAMPFNTRGMYRGAVDTDGTVTVAIYADEPPAATDP
jgi:beta-aspartyl-peptidase (threonine type)